jgi:hypothetical protein
VLIAKAMFSTIRKYVYPKVSSLNKKRGGGQRTSEFGAAYVGTEPCVQRRET